MAFFKGIFVNLFASTNTTKVAPQPVKTSEKKMGLFAPVAPPKPLGVKNPKSNIGVLTATGERRVDQLKSEFLS